MSGNMAEKYYSERGVTLYLGTASHILRSVPRESVDCVVTSPPYFALRDYDTPGQIGTERTPEEFIRRLVGVFRRVRNVLKPTGVCFVNIGDTYNSYPGNSAVGRQCQELRPDNQRGYGLIAPDLKPKELLGIPWMLAFAMRADGWLIRQEIIWHKPTVQPETVTDRFTRDHETVLLFTRETKYWWNKEAVQEPASKLSRPRGQGNNPKAQANAAGSKQNSNWSQAMSGTVATRNKRTVWSIPSRGYPGAHFATFPNELVTPCVLAGCPEGGLVLDPFVGSGTVCEVARNNGCRAIGIDINQEYLDLAVARLKQKRLF